MYFISKTYLAINSISLTIVNNLSRGHSDIFSVFKIIYFYCQLIEKYLIIEILSNN